MAQYIQNADIFGRIGSGIGQGISESLPKEIERGRLAEGLQQLAKQKDLTPFERFSGLASLPGTNPQIIQSGADILNQQAKRDAYERRANLAASPEAKNYQSQSGLKDIQFGQTNPNQQRGQTVPSDQPRNVEALQSPGAAKENPLSEKFMPPSPWNIQMQEDAINDAFKNGLANTFEEANSYANQRKQLYESAPEKYRAQLEYQKGVDNEVDSLFDKDLETRLQKKGDNTFSDVPGDLQLDIKKQARNAVATGKMNPQQAADYYTKKALDLTKDRNRVLEIANRDLSDRLLPYKKEENLKNLMDVGKSFKEMGSSEYLFNLLKDKREGEDGAQLGMGLSPGGAAIISFPRSGQVNGLISRTRVGKNPSMGTRAFADELSKVMTPEDSFLAIARVMKQKDSNFDEYAFFDYLRENRDKYSSNARLKREISQGVSDFFPDWRDVGLFPAFKQSVANE